MILRELTGSPKQISWAVNIRTERLKTWKEQSPKLFKRMESELVRMTSSEWWIDYREKDLGTAEKHIQYEVKLKTKKANSVITMKKRDSGSDSIVKSSPALKGFRFTGEIMDVITGEMVTDEDDSLPF